MIRTKVCIVGAGPAGACLSHFLSKEKIDHVLVDKASFPRDKVCGDGITLDALNILRRLSPQLLKKFVESSDMLPSDGFCFHAPNGRELRYDFSHLDLPYAPFYTSRRVHLDSFLIENLPQGYVRLLTEHKVVDITRIENGFEVQLEGEKINELQCDYIIGAEGEKPIVSRCLGLTHFREKEHLCGALRVYYKGVEGLHKNNHLEFYIDKEILPGGYFWIFPLSNGEANVGLGMISSEISKGKINLKKKLDYFITQHPTISKMFKNAIPLEKPQGWGLPIVTSKRKITGDGYALIGDAAGMIEPLTGKGIGPGMVSARFLCEHLKEAISNNSKDLSDYESHMYRYYKSEMRLGYFAHRRLRKPWLISLIADVSEWKPIHYLAQKKMDREWRKWIVKI